MAKSLIIAISLGFLAMFIVSCTDPYFVSRPQKPAFKPDTVSVCQAPVLEKNIIGTWHFDATTNYINNPSGMSSGTITFTAQGDIIDPDTLFQNNFPGIGPALSKSYKTSVKYTDFLPGNYFVVYVNTKNGPQTTPFVPLINECKRIVLGLRGSQDYAIRITLTR